MDLTLLPILLLATPSAVPPLHIHAALSGRPSYWHCLHFCLGMQSPLSPSALNNGEYPACAAMTTGYVFRVENQGTVMYLQKVGRTGHLTTLDVTTAVAKTGPGIALAGFPAFVLVARLLSSQPRTRSIILTTTILLLLSRILSIMTLRARTAPSWHGAPERGVKGDLLVLLSEDRWIRMQGLVDDLKAVTSGSWLGRPKYPQLMDALDWISRMLVYIAAVVLVSASDEEKLMFVLSILLSHVILAYSSSKVTDLVMNERRIKIAGGSGGVKKYSRRLELAEELIGEMGRSDFAVRLGLINPEQAESSEAKTVEGVESEIVAM